jgi:hypothetical protein
LLPENNKSDNDDADSNSEKSADFNKSKKGGVELGDLSEVQEDELELMATGN